MGGVSAFPGRAGAGGGRLAGMSSRLLLLAAAVLVLAGVGVAGALRGGGAPESGGPVPAPEPVLTTQGGPLWGLDLPPDPVRAEPDRSPLITP